MKKPWESFEKEYEAVPYTDERTGKQKVRYEYRGTWYDVRNEKEQFRMLKRIIGAAGVVNMVVVLWAGLVRAQINRAALTALPYGLALAALIFVTIGAAALLFSGTRLKSADHLRIRRMICIAAPVETTLLGFAFVAGMIMTAGNLAENILPLAGFLAGACCAVAIRILYEKIIYDEMKEERIPPADLFIRETTDRER